MFWAVVGVVVVVVLGCGAWADRKGSRFRIDGAAVREARRAARSRRRWTR